LVDWLIGFEGKNLGKFGDQYCNLQAHSSNTDNFSAYYCLHSANISLIRDTPKIANVWTITVWPRACFRLIA